MSPIEQYLNQMRREGACRIDSVTRAELIHPLPQLHLQHLYEIFPGLNESAIFSLAASIPNPIPEEYRDFLRLTNGLSLFGDTLRLGGVPDYSIRELSSKYPPSLESINGLRTPDTPKDWLIIATYSMRGGLEAPRVCIDCTPGLSPRPVYLLPRDSDTIVKRWYRFENWFTEEFDQLDQLFHAEKYRIFHQSGSLPAIRFPENDPFRHHTERITIHSPDLYYQNLTPAARSVEIDLYAILDQLLLDAQVARNYAAEHYEALRSRPAAHVLYGPDDLWLGAANPGSLASPKCRKLSEKTRRKKYLRYELDSHYCILAVKHMENHDSVDHTDYFFRLDGCLYACSFFRDSGTPYTDLVQCIGFENGLPIRYTHATKNSLIAEFLEYPDWDEEVTMVTQYSYHPKWLQTPDGTPIRRDAPYGAKDSPVYIQHFGIPRTNIDFSRFFKETNHAR